MSKEGEKAAKAVKLVLNNEICRIIVKKIVKIFLFLI